MFIRNVELISYAEHISCNRSSCNNQSETSIADTWHMEIPN